MSKSSYNTVISDLTFYYNEGASVLGLHSGYSSFLSRIYCGSTTIVEADPMEKVNWKKVRRYSRIDNILRHLTSEQRKVLDAIYNPEYSWNRCKLAGEAPHPLTKIYGKQAGCVLFSTALLYSSADPMQKLHSLLERRLHKKLSADEQKLSFQIGQEAKALYEQVHAAYLAASK